ncbi:hypothetical protein AQUCO_08200032v1 [Aquilegia coerulea]|uniref:Uncharacterized protein n=1 Tax=Aquilegia coerulea TaxID=218851 RepID=A0A2G5C7H6_AQUCA|nr:hypothetical protein AQUCO_08200032v1 [Aquilegia coerulea]
MLKQKIATRKRWRQRKKTDVYLQLCLVYLSLQRYISYGLLDYMFFFKMASITTVQGNRLIKPVNIVLYSESRNTFF